MIPVVDAMFAMVAGVATYFAASEGARLGMEVRCLETLKALDGALLRPEVRTPAKVRRRLQRARALLRKKRCRTNLTAARDAIRAYGS
jgi:hypothetical protein